MNRYMNDPCVIDPEIFFPLNISVDRNAAIWDCSDGSLSPVSKSLKYQSVSSQMIGGDVYMQYNIEIGRAKQKWGSDTFMFIFPACNFNYF